MHPFGPDPARRRPSAAAPRRAPCSIPRSTALSTPVDYACLSHAPRPNRGPNRVRQPQISLLRRPLRRGAELRRRRRRAPRAFHPEPLDPDLVARIKGGAVLISAVHLISGGQGGSGAWGRRGSPELLVPRRRVTGEGQSGALGVGLGRGLAGEVDRGMRNPLGWISRCCGGAKQGAWRGGGLAWRHAAGGSVFVPRGWASG